MRVALYARVSTERQEKERTIESQVDALRSFAHEHGHLIVEPFVCLDEGQSGARLDRPALDRLRDGARDGAFEAVLVLCPDRLARKYVYQVLILEELEKWGVQVIFLEQPLTDDPQAHLLLQIQGAVAEYERTKMAERYRRGKLYRARQGEVVVWKVPYGYRRVPRSSGSPARLEVFEPEATIVRQIFSWHVEEHLSTRELAKRLTVEQIPTPHGSSRYWGTSTIGRILHNQAYVGMWQTNQRQMTRITDPKSRYRWQTMPRDRQDWIAIPVPPIVDADLFQRSQQIHRDNSRFSPRHLGRPWWLLRCLVWCGECQHGCRCHNLRTRNGTLTAITTVRVTRLLCLPSSVVASATFVPTPLMPLSGTRSVRCCVTRRSSSKRLPEVVNSCRTTMRSSTSWTL